MCFLYGKINGQMVAVKQLAQDGVQGSHEFLVEVLMLTMLNHKNLVSLVGFCAQGDERLLVYEYMPFGSLESHLFGTNIAKRSQHTLVRVVENNGGKKQGIPVFVVLVAARFVIR